MSKELIQYISVNKEIKGSLIVNGSISNPNSLDEFEITVLDLSDKSIWVSETQELKSIYMQDLINIAKMINNSHSTKIIIICPQNCKFTCVDDLGRNKSVQLKNKLDSIMKLYMENIFSINETFLFEHTRTKIEGAELTADFYLHFPKSPLTKSIKSNKITTAKVENIIVTTLSINTYDNLISFCNKLKLLQSKEDIPEWMKSIDMFDDENQKMIIEEHTKIIEQSNRNIQIANNILNKNNEYKSILYTNGDELAKVVFDILEQCLDYDLSDFVDEKKEDFLINKHNITFIGEIKGVTNNIKSENVSQLDVHLQKYQDKLKNENKEENVKSLLIMCHQRKKPINEREPVNKEQINLAKRNKSLIIETITLLELFEKFKNDDISIDKIVKLLSKNTGLLEL